MIAFAEDALDEARTDLGWAEQRPERHRFGESGSFRLQEDQEVHDHDRANAGGDGQYQREQCKRQVLLQRHARALRLVRRHACDRIAPW